MHIQSCTIFFTFGRLQTEVKLLIIKKGDVPWRLLRTTYGYHKNDKTLKFAAIPRIQVTPIAEAILTPIRATLVLWCWFVTFSVLWWNKKSNNLWEPDTVIQENYGKYLFLNIWLYDTRFISHLSCINDMDRGVSQSKHIVDNHQCNRQNKRIKKGLRLWYETFFLSLPCWFQQSAIWRFSELFLCGLILATVIKSRRQMYIIC